MSVWLLFLIQISIIAVAFVGGIFLAFSDFIMRALGQTSGAGGPEAMQIINREVFRWVFMALFLGLVPVSAALMIYGLAYLDGTAQAVIVCASLIYLVGCFGVTIGFNVPLNEALAKMDTASETTKAYWTDVYLPRWRYWNTVRTVACAASSVLLMIGWQALWQTQ